jgi:hypothetical protein
MYDFQLAFSVKTVKEWLEIRQHIRHLLQLRLLLLDLRPFLQCFMLQRPEHGNAVPHLLNGNLRNRKSSLEPSDIPVALGDLPVRLSQPVGTIEDLRGHGVGVVSVAEPLGAGDEASNTLIRNIFGSFGQYEKDKIKGRLRGGALAKAREGKYAGGRPPYGYTTSPKKTLIPDVAKVDVIRKAFSLNSRKYSLSEIADELNGQGWVTTTGKPWRKQAVDRILKDKLFYRGHYAYADIEAKGQHEAILH